MITCYDELNEQIVRVLRALGDGPDHFITQYAAQRIEDLEKEFAAVMKERDSLREAGIQLSNTHRNTTEILQSADRLVLSDTSSEFIYAADGTKEAWYVCREDLEVFEYLHPDLEWTRGNDTAHEYPTLLEAYRVYDLWRVMDSYGEVNSE